MTLVEMLEKNARNIPDKVAIIHHDLRITYGELNSQVNRLAHALLNLGLKKEDRICLMLPRIPELVITFLAAAKAQGIVVPINFELNSREITALLENLSPRFLILHESFLDLAKKTLPQDLKFSVIVVGNECDDNFYRWHDILKDRNQHNLSLEIKEDDVVYLNYTSGTSGDPKGAITTHSNILWNTLASIETLKLTPDDIHLCMFAPFAHPHELFARPLYLGGTFVLLETIRPKSIAKSISENEVTCLMAIAPILMTLLEIARSGQYDLSSLRIPESGGMHTRVELIKQFEQRFGVPILPVWGSTETTGIAIANSPDKGVVYGSVGRPCKSYEVKIVGEDGNELPPHKIGDLIFRGPAVVSGYYNNSGNPDSFKNGWYLSGDLAKKDEEGNFYFVERKSGMLKVAGLQVYPLEIELTLSRHPAIKEAAVIGVEDNLRGEVPKAIVVLKNEHKLKEREIIQYCLDNMAHYKVPRVIEFREDLPKIGSGKINKKALKLEIA